MKKKTRLAVIIVCAACAAALLFAVCYYAVGYVCVSREVSAAEGDVSSYEIFSLSLSRLFKTKPDALYIKVRYLLTGKVDSDGVVSGKNDFLFPSRTDSFDYAADYAGEYGYTQDELSELCGNLITRHDAYAADGIDYYVFIIPNSQSVYGSFTPWGAGSADTRAEQLYAYCSANGAAFLYLTDSALSSAPYQTYDNTQNSVNAYGAYVLYTETIKRLPYSVSKRSNVQTTFSSDISVYKTKGGALAQAVGLEYAVMNRTLSIDSGRLTRQYQLSAASSASLEMYDMTPEYDTFLGSSCVLFEIPYENERALLRPLFSATYTDTSYKADLDYSSAASERSNASAAVLFLREDDLDSLFDEYAAATFDARLQSSAGDCTSPVELVCTATLSDGRILAAGRCEGDSTITCYLPDGSEVSFAGSDGSFLVPLSVEDGARVRFVASLPGKAASESVSLIIEKNGSGSPYVCAGNSSYLYYKDTVSEFTGVNLYSDKRLLGIKTRLSERAELLKQSAGKAVKQLLLICPDPLTVYPQIASAEHAAQRAEYTVYDQLVGLFSDCDEVTVLDIRQLMKDNADIGKLYHQTDTHWTELGAYFGYYAVVSEISKDFPTRPHSLDEISVEMLEAQAGDMAGFLGLDGLTELVPHLTAEYEKRSDLDYVNPTTIDRSELVPAFSSSVSDPSLPSAIMLRDSYSTQLFPFMSEHFSSLYCEEMWDYSLDYELVARLSPDYIIYIVCERNISSISLS